MLLFLCEICAHTLVYVYTVSEREYKKLRATIAGQTMGLEVCEEGKLAFSLPFELFILANSKVGK